MASEYELGILAGILIGEGHFGGDGRQPHVTLRMHIRHAALFRWLERTFPGGRVYGPYNHSGREYYQWMARGAFLREELLPVLERVLTPELDGHSFDRFRLMVERYGLRRMDPSETAAQPEAVTVPEPLKGAAQPEASRLSRLFQDLAGPASDQTG